MATLKDFRDERLRKLADLKKLGINPFPSKSSRTHYISDIVNRFDDLQGQNVTVAGRVMGIRKFGKIAFVVLRDFSGKIQLFLQSDTTESLNVGEDQLGLNELPLLDSGDFVEADGQVSKTRRRIL
jgi:lysyl-tRNA synthetase class 2